MKETFNLKIYESTPREKLIFCENELTRKEVREAIHRLTKESSACVLTRNFQFSIPLPLPTDRGIIFPDLIFSTPQKKLHPQDALDRVREYYD